MENLVIGVSLSEPHTSELKCNFVCIYLEYAVLYIKVCPLINTGNARIAEALTNTLSRVWNMVTQSTRRNEEKVIFCYQLELGK